MTIRETTIAKLQQLPEVLLHQVSNFIDRLLSPLESGHDEPQEAIAEAWSHWFDAVDGLEVMPTESNSDYSQLLLSKYRQQGLDL